MKYFWFHSIQLFRSWSFLPLLFCPRPPGWIWRIHLIWVIVKLTAFQGSGAFCVFEVECINSSVSTQLTGFVSDLRLLNHTWISAHIALLQAACALRSPQARTFSVKIYVWKKKNFAHKHQSKCLNKPKYETRKRLCCDACALDCLLLLSAPG